MYKHLINIMRLAIISLIIIILAIAFAFGYYSFIAIQWLLN